MYKQYLFYSIKLLALMVIFLELSTVRMILLPDSYFEFLHISKLIWVYVEHFALSIVFVGLGALILLRLS